MNFDSYKFRSQWTRIIKALPYLLKVEQNTCWSELIKSAFNVLQLDVTEYGTTSWYEKSRTLYAARWETWRDWTCCIRASRVLVAMSKCWMSAACLSPARASSTWVPINCNSKDSRILWVVLFVSLNFCMKRYLSS